MHHVSLTLPLSYIPCVSFSTVWILDQHICYSSCVPWIRCLLLIWLRIHFSNSVFFSFFLCIPLWQDVLGNGLFLTLRTVLQVKPGNHLLRCYRAPPLNTGYITLLSEAFRNTFYCSGQFYRTTFLGYFFLYSSWSPGYGWDTVLNPVLIAVGLVQWNYCDHRFICMLALGKPVYR